MDAENTARRARQLFETDLYCAESVLKAVAEALEIESDLVPAIATGFCSGQARMSSTPVDLGNDAGGYLIYKDVLKAVLSGHGREGTGATPPADARPHAEFPDMRSFAAAACV